MGRMRYLMLPLLLLAIPAMAQTPPAPPEAQRLVPGRQDGYLVDAQKGCWVWTGGMRAEDTELTVRWSGNCPQGPAEGAGRAVTSWRQRGQLREMVFEGTLRGGKAEGHGALAHLEDGDPVVLESGEYREDYLVSGRIEIPGPGLVYEGGVRRGQPQGEGRLTLQGRRFEGQWQNGCLQLPDGNWISFTRPPESCRTVEG
jgi:hypothetical protein